MLRNLFLTFLLLSLSCSEFGKSIRDTSQDLFLKTLELTRDDNVAISPLSINTVLTMLAMGSENRAREEIANFLNVESQSGFQENFNQIVNCYQTPESSVLLANALFPTIEANIKSEYRKILKENFASEIHNVNFSNPNLAVSEINSWVANQTNNLVTDLLSSGSVNQETLLVLSNTVYFKSQWKVPFDKRRSRNDTFLGKKLWAEYMVSESQIEIAELEDMGADLVVIPYKDDSIKMLIYHPKEADGTIEAVEEAFLQDSTSISSHLRQTKSEFVKLSLPKFDISFETSMVEVLERLNVTTIFSTQADFSRISDIPLSVHDILHKTRIIVDEEGTEAAAASGAVIDTRLGIVKVKEVNINSPFLFIIYDTKNDIPLFVGKITNPSSQNSALIENRKIQKNDEDQSNKVDQERNKPKKVCSGSSLKVCIAEVCNFLDTNLQKLCILDCSDKCKTN